MTSFMQAVDDEIAALERELEKQPVFVKLRELKRVRSLYVSGADLQHKAPSNIARNEALLFKVHRKKNAPPMSGKTLDAINAAIGVLDAHGRPLRTVQLLGHLTDMGITFTGSSPQNTLSTLLSRATEIESRGGHLGWALKKWNSTEDNLLNGLESSVDSNPEAQDRKAGSEGGP
jgi:hypothetical protein